jgi:hypothetical protein
MEGSCDNGELYEDEDERISCSVCDFEMCYTHQSAWHDGFTCEEFDSQQEHDDSHTQDWLDQNAKPCPGPVCGVYITKRGGCFHMTCKCIFVTRGILGSLLTRGNNSQVVPVTSSFAGSVGPIGTTLLTMVLRGTTKVATFELAMFCQQKSWVLLSTRHFKRTTEVTDRLPNYHISVHSLLLP